MTFCPARRIASLFVRAGQALETTAEPARGVPKSRNHHEPAYRSRNIAEYKDLPMEMVPSKADRNRRVVRGFYEGAAQAGLGSFKDYIAEKFHVYAPRYLPWGGRSDKQRYIDWVIPQVVAILDFDRLSYESLTAEGEHVVAFINIGVRGTDQSIMISEHWDLADEKAIKLRVAYFEPQVLLERLGLPSF